MRNKEERGKACVCCGPPTTDPTPISAEMELHVLREEEKRENRRLMRLFDEEQRRKRKSIRLQLERDWNQRKWLREYSLKTGNNATTTGKDCAISSNDKKDNTHISRNGTACTER